MFHFEEKMERWIATNNNVISPRLKRFIAMYFPNAKIRRQFWIETCVKLGNQTFLNPNVTVSDDYQSGEILLEIGDNCSIAPGVVFAPYSSHNNSKKLRENGTLARFEKREKITIGNDVWIGANCTIGAGVTVGDSCIIGANSFVNKDIPPGHLAFGVPVKIVEKIG